MILALTFKILHMILELILVKYGLIRFLYHASFLYLSPG